MLLIQKFIFGSAKNFFNRKKRHFEDLEKNKHHNIKLQRAYNKHGADNFIFEIIEILEYTKDLIIERENFYISEYNAKTHGYNMADASFGDCLSAHPNKREIRKKITDTINFNISKLSEKERKDKFGKPGELNGMFGKKHSNESKQKMSKNQRLYKIKHRSWSY